VVCPGRCVKRRDRHRFSLICAACRGAFGLLAFARAAWRPTPGRFLFAAVFGAGVVVCLLTWRVLAGSR
jgi:hypothetical protein